METFNNAIKEKFSGLLFFLRRSKTEFEMVADEMEDHSLRTALNSLSDDSNYYAGELKNYLKTFGIYPQVNESVIEVAAIEYSEDYKTDSPEKGNELHTICNYNEASLTQAYNELLEENMPFQILKDIMLYQLNALRNTFMKINALNSARFLFINSNKF